MRGQWDEKKGADRGIDGTIGLWKLNQYCQAVIQVKGGNALTLSAVRDFGRVIERENAVMGLMIAQKEPTKEMIKEAESLGYADWPSERKYPRYQIRSLKDLLENPTRPFEIPDATRPGLYEGVGKKVDDTQMKLLEE